MGRRQFGSVRRRSSGRWEASYWHEGDRHLGPHMFPTKANACAWLAGVETSIRSGAWFDPRSGRTTFAEYAAWWLEARSDLRPRSVEQYTGMLRRHLIPAFGDVELARLKPSDVRSWYGRLRSIRPNTAAGADRLLRAIYNTAVRDELVAANPCRIIGGGTEHTPERPLLTLAQVETLLGAMAEELRPAVVLAAWGGLRRGEVLGLQRRDVNEVTGQVRIERTLHEMHDGRIVLGPPKSSAGRRTVHLPRQAMAAVGDHLRTTVAVGAESHLFTGSNGNPLRPRTLETAWRRARTAASLPAVHFHDLRHFHLTLYATTGATTAELMARAGHASAKAALTYQHATEDRDRVLTAVLGQLMDGARTAGTRDRTAPHRPDRSRPDRAQTDGAATAHPA